ncbi:PEGA domain-containing protein [Sorangium sp. So ce131]|uniref:PEGA domain-containing protein n=1 Tax=Sorangium sp. So ce131 TaxID=3133282 RepID=UPI003F647369
MGGLFAALLLASPEALAQSSASDQAAADALYDEGQALLKAGDLAAGCAKFEASLALSPAASTMIQIARCHEREEKLATAWADYTQALRLNGDTPGAARRKQLEELARQGIRALDPRLPRLRIELKSPPPGVQVRSDDKELPAAVLGEALPADPGPHLVRVSAPGHHEATRSVTLEEGKTTVVELELQRAAAQVQPSLEPQEAAVERAAAQVQPSARSWSRPTGIALAAAGAVGLGVGAVTGVLSLNKVSSIGSSDACPGYPRCPAEDGPDKATLESAKALGNASTAGFIAGGVLAATGVVLLLLRPGDESTPAAAGDRTTSFADRVRVTVGPGRIGFQGSF